MKIIGVTGHREVDNQDSVISNIKYSLRYFNTIHNGIRGISAVAIGADTWFALEAEKNNIPLEIYLPFNIEEYGKDFTDAADLHTFHKLINKHPHNSLTEMPSGTHEERNAAYLQNGKRIVDRSDITLAIWDGETARGVGGTADIVAYAEEQSKELHIIKAIREKLTGKDDAHSKFKEFDSRAIHYKNRRFQPIWIAGITLGLLAVIFFSVSLCLKERLSKETIFYTEIAEVFCLVLSAIMLLFFARRWKNSFIVNRRSAEYLRSVLWYRDAGIPIRMIDTIGYKPAPVCMDIEQRISADMPLPGSKYFESAKRIAWCLAESQIDYQLGRKKRLKRKLENIEELMKWVRRFFFMAVALKFLGELQIHFDILQQYSLESLHPWCNLVIIFLPAFYAALEGIIYFNEWKKNTENSTRITTDLEASKSVIIACKDIGELVIATAVLRGSLESENNDWANELGRKKIEPNL